MSQNLPGLGIAGPGKTSGLCTYNGFTFAGPRLSSAITLTPERDEADRTVVFNVYRLTITGIITNDTAGQGAGSDATVLTDTAQTNILTIQSQLSKDGASLIYDPGWGQGSGNTGQLFTVNTGASDRDVAWGPKTRSIQISPVGTSLAFHVVWVVEFSIPQCTSGQVPASALGLFRSFNFGIVYSINDRGLTTRTTKGHVSMTQNRSAANSNSFSQTADSLREQIVPTVPVGFKRDTHEYTLSQDKARLDFNFVDRELPSENSFPPGISNMEASQSMRVQFPKFIRVPCQISGFVEVVKGVAVSDGMNFVLTFLQERIGYARNRAPLFITELEVTEDIFGRRIDFSIRWWFTCSQMQSAIYNSALFSAVQSFDPGAWNASMSSSAWRPRGVANLIPSITNDVIVDPCNQTLGSGFDYATQLYNYGQSGTLSNTVPPASQSYLKWENRLESQAKSVQSINTPMPSSAGNSGTRQEVQGMKGYIIVGPDGTPTYYGPSTVQVSADRIKVFMIGEAIRIGYPCEIPTLVSFLNNQYGFALADSYVSNEIIGSSDNGVAIYGAVWRFEYDVYVTADQLTQFLNDLPSALVTTDDDPNGLKVFGQ